MSASIAEMKQLRLILLLLICLATVSCSMFASRQQELNAELMRAIKAANADALDENLSRGANPDASTGNKGTALGTLIQQYKRSHQERRVRIEKCTKVLLEYNADPEMLHHGFTPLQIATGQGSDVIVVELLRCKANPSRETAAGLAPIWQAVYTNNYRIGMELLRAGANPNATDAKGRTPLEYLRSCGYQRTRLMIMLRHYGGH